MTSNPANRNFELCMSKKVAELTQVIHMLFMKNHEKELELEALKNAYEYEIELVLADAKGQIGELNHRLAEKEQLLKQMKDHQNQSESDRKKLEALEKVLKDERTECQKVRDLLIRSQMDVQSMREFSAEKQQEHDEEIQQKTKEINQLKSHINDLERLMKFKDSQTAQQSNSLRKLVEKLQGEAELLKIELNNSENLRETLFVRSRNLEDDARRLKRELARRTSYLDDGSKQNAIVNNDESVLRNPNHEKEIQILKEEIRRYRMELSNREVNFNRRFARSRPVVLNQRPTTGLSSVATTFYSSAPKNNELDDRIIDLVQVNQQHSNATSNSALGLFSSSPCTPTSSMNSERLPYLNQNSPLRRPTLEKPQLSKILMLKKSQ